MSMAALLTGTRDWLRSELSYSDNNCDVRPGGKPPASMGQFYVSLEDSGVGSREKLQHLEEIYSITVYVTRRTGEQPRDRTQAIYLAATTGLDARCRAILTKIHRNFDLMTSINELITDDGDLFQLPLFYQGVAGPQFMGPDWAASVNDTDSFLVKALRFGGALRVQDVDIMT